MKAARHKWHMFSIGGDVRCYTFACSCGFVVMQAPEAGSFPDAFVRAVAEHLRAVDREQAAKVKPAFKIITGGLGA